MRSALSALSDLPATDRMPALFVGHGSPMAAIRPGVFAERWREIGRRLPTPRAILMISAHWLTRGETRVTSNVSPRMNYDMYGFPRAMYAIEYRAPGSPELAREVEQAIEPHRAVVPDTEWGYDHGAWLPLMYMFPGGPIPLVQLSIDFSQPPESHFELGRTLQPLRSRGVVVMGSGNLVHNLHWRGPAGAGPFAWAEEFDRTITGFVEDGDYPSVVRFRDLGELAREAHPTPEHFLPLLYVLGGRENGESVSIFNDEFQESSVSMTSFVVA